MDLVLSKPVTVKASSHCENKLYKVGSSCMQGWRKTMEDAHTHILSLPEDPSTPFFAVFDGHGGDKIAQHAGQHLYKYIEKRPEYQDNEKIVEALQQGYLSLDAAMDKQKIPGNDFTGATALSILIKNNILYCANVGDSRAVASIGGQASPLSSDHKPYNEEEYKRIYAAGGSVLAGRVNGDLALSRALGDFRFKRNAEKRPEEQMVTAFPEVLAREITSDWEFVVMACDGIWDVMTNQEVVDFVEMRIGAGRDPTSICEDLMTCCLSNKCWGPGIGCDNMTAIIIYFLHDKPFSDLVNRCSGLYHNKFVRKIKTEA